MVVRLRYGRTVTGASLAAAVVRFAQGLINLGSFLLDPGKQSRTEVEANPSVIVHQLHDALFTVEDPRLRIRCVALRRHPLVPIVIWVSGILQLDGFQ